MSAVAGILETVVATGAALDPSPGVTGTVGLVVTGGADGEIRVRIRVVDGRPAEASEDGATDPDLTLTLAAADARAVVDGALDPSVAFMRGRLKTVGDNGLLLGLLAAAAAPRFGSWIAGVVSPPPDAK